MKVTHRVPAIATEPRSAVVDEAYAREVERDTARGEARYRRAAARVEAAEKHLARLERQRGAKSKTRQIREAAAAVELRRQELATLHGVMQAAPASAIHRGRRSFRPVPTPGAQP